MGRDWTQPRRRPGSPRRGGAEEAFRASKSGRNLLENAPELEPDIPFCARESVLDVVPRLVELRDGAAQISR